MSVYQYAWLCVCMCMRICMHAEVCVFEFQVCIHPGICAKGHERERWREREERSYREIMRVFNIFFLKFLSKSSQTNPVSVYQI